MWTCSSVSTCCCAGGYTSHLLLLLEFLGESMASQFDHKEFLLSGSENTLKRPLVPKKKFFYARTAFDWMASASLLPGKSLQVALMICHVAVLTRSNQVRLSSRKVELFGVSRGAKLRALRWLEKAGLIAVERRSGRNPIVTLIGI